MEYRTNGVFTIFYVDFNCDCDEYIVIGDKLVNAKLRLVDYVAETGIYKVEIKKLKLESYYTYDSTDDTFISATEQDIFNKVIQQEREIKLKQLLDE